MPIASLWRFPAAFSFFLVSIGDEPHSMLFALYEGPLVLESVRVEVDALAFLQIVSVLAFMHSSVFLEVNSESVLLFFAPVALGGVSTWPFHPPQALLVPF